jgi:hypothetical protein
MIQPMYTMVINLPRPNAIDLERKLSLAPQLRPRSDLTPLLTELWIEFSARYTGRNPRKAFAHWLLYHIE